MPLGSSSAAPVMMPGPSRCQGWLRAGTGASISRAMTPDLASIDQRTDSVIGSMAGAVVAAPLEAHNAEMSLDYTAFKSSLADAAPPAQVPPLLAALWHAGKGEWDRAHEIAQEDESATGSWVHAYLHRVEGDES